MKMLVCCIICGLQATGTACLPAQEPGRRITLVPTNAIDAARSRVKEPDIFRIATNTLAFEEYGLNMMLAVANETRVKWKLDLPAPLTVNDVLFTLTRRLTELTAVSAQEMAASIGRFRGTHLRAFKTVKSYPRSFRHKDDESARLTKIKSKITAKEAEAIARGVLHEAWAYRETTPPQKSPPAVNQYKFEETDGTVYPLPMFNVAWCVEGDDDNFPPVTVDVYGISKNVAEYYDLSRYAPRVPTPTKLFACFACRTTTWRQCLSLSDSSGAWRRSPTHLHNLRTRVNDSAAPARSGGLIEEDKTLTANHGVVFLAAPTIFFL